MRTLLALGCALVLAAAAALSYRLQQNPLRRKYGDALLARVYPGWTPAEIDRLHRETWLRPPLYEPFTQFKERPIAGRYVHVDENGFRRLPDPGPWPPDPKAYNVFVFGDSTEFGYGAADGQTIAAHLRGRLRAAVPGAQVYNLGRADYYSSQESVLFERLLAAGIAPRLAIFIDGPNEFLRVRDEPAHTGPLAAFMDGPVSRRLRALLPPDREPPPLLAESGLDAVMARYQRNKRLIESSGAAFGVATAFVWRPIPNYRYDPRWFPFTPDKAHRNAPPGYARAAERFPGRLGADFLWCADFQDELRGPLYVDAFHYSDAMSAELARRIYLFLAQRRLLPAIPRR